MRARLGVLVAATTSVVILAFLLPLLVVLHTFAHDRAAAAATQSAQSLGAAVPAALGRPDRLRALVQSSDAGTGERTSLVLPDGQVIGAPTTDPGIARARAGEAFTADSDGGPVVMVPVVTEAGTAVVRVAVPEAVAERGIGTATVILVAFGVLLFAAAVLAADLLGRRVSAPIRAVAGTADALREGKLETRAEESGPPEVVALARALNRLAGRISELLAAERDAVADLSHRLRTPVTALRLDADSVADADVAERLRQHVGVLQRTVDAIVHDARRPIASTVGARCDVVRVVSDRVAFWSALADEQDRPLCAELPAGPVPAGIAAEDLADVVDALIDNGFAHTPDTAAIHLRVRSLMLGGTARGTAGGTAGRTAGGAELVVQDGGPGLPGGDVAQRGRSAAGSSGLGLDTVRRAAIASGGGLDLGRSPLGGARVRVVLGPADP